ncbi:T9SS type B sorting domain-containing protein [Pseudozobellia thermophila]|uniref:Gliding motility-associated C-terminal domain-containing protein n=1 Tax=Pseudozobellia thermophila TaxID=192903 RepID=A0A1M6EIV1_9FLAO|nr:T9SS type B sorting domain-containing protein [Pseudozobellia thermophila]SHI85427.1 gliding motility-associated C-terminal domain-containing protein [Pseudozobellia thermophila]
MKLYLLLPILFFFQFIDAQVTPAEKAALQAFYIATDGPNWDSETDGDPTNDWDFTGPVTDDWYGLTIVGGHVVGMDMNPTDNGYGNNNLTGVIPEEIGDLSFLQTLDLSNQNLNGTIPNRLTELTELQWLQLKANNFTGTIPSDIDNLTKLIHLDISSNQMTGEIPLAVTRLANLRTLNLRGNKLSGEIPIEITDMINLRVLRLGNNQFTGTVYPEYGNLTNLTELGLGSNQLSGEIPITLQSLIDLRILNLSHNQLTGTLPVELRSLINAEIIDFSYNGLVGNIPPEYGEWLSIVSLSLSSNQLSGQIPESFNKLVTLEYLDLGHNSLTGTLFPSFSAWTKIKTLNLSANQLSGNIPDSYASFVNLESLWLSDNLFSGELSPSFSQWTNIKSLYLFLNNFSGEIPETYSSFVNLEYLNISKNQFSGELSPSFSNWLNIKTLDFGHNQFEGSVPNFTGVLTGTDFLEIRSNNFQFGDFEDEFDYYDQSIAGFHYSPQAKVNDTETFNRCTGSSLTLSTVVSGSANVYQWFKDGAPISGATDADLVLDPLSVSDAGVYTCEITSTIVTGLTLERNPITITVNNNGPTANVVADIYSCDLDGDGYTTFAIDLADIEAQAIGTQTGVTVSYFDVSGTPLALTDPYTNTVQDQEAITVRVSDSGGCYNESVFNLIATQPITADSLEDVIACGSYILPALNTGNRYFTGTNASGTQLQPGDEITSSQTIYIHTGAGNCGDETSFNLTIDAPATVDQLNDVTECEAYVLPELVNGNYYTESGGQGIALYEGDSITETTTLYVYKESGSCSNESSFTVNIVPSLSVDQLNDVTECEAYVLPELVNGNYYTESGGQGIALYEGDSITETTTLYVYKESGSCSDESSFTVNIDLLACEGPNDPKRVLFPKFFTPNNDGVNDRWKVDQEFFTLEGTVSIYDRYGKLLSHFDALSGSWDGTLNGRRLPASDYWFKFVERDGKTTITGHFSLKR